MDVGIVGASGFLGSYFAGDLLRHGHRVRGLARSLPADATPGIEWLQGDLASAYWYSENMKYYWLMFGRAQRFDYNNNYLTTEGDVLRGLL